MSKKDSSRRHLNCISGTQCSWFSILQWLRFAPKIYGAHVKNWLLCVSANECKKHWRSPWKKIECLDDYADSLAFEEPEYSNLFHAIMELEQKYRVVIVLYYYEGYAIKEIAKFLRIPQGTVGTRLSRARDQLKQYLQGE